MVDTVNAEFFSQHPHLIYEENTQLGQYAKPFLQDGPGPRAGNTLAILSSEQIRISQFFCQRPSS